MPPRSRYFDVNRARARRTPISGLEGSRGTAPGYAYISSGMNRGFVLPRGRAGGRDTGAGAARRGVAAGAAPESGPEADEGALLSEGTGGAGDPLSDGAAEVWASDAGGGIGADSARALDGGGEIGTGPTGRRRSRNRITTPRATATPASAATVHSSPRETSGAARDRATAAFSSRRSWMSGTPRPTAPAPCPGEPSGRAAPER